MTRLLTLALAGALAFPAAADGARKPPYDPPKVRRGCVGCIIEWGPRNVREAVENMTIWTICQTRPADCPAQPEPKPRKP